MTEPLASEIVSECERRGLRIVLVESCTGGMIASAIVGVPGSSAVLDRGLVTYSNEAKIELADVEADAIAEHGAVSFEVATQMALGGIRRSPADLAMAVTGIAGPGGGTPNKPVGLVYVAIASRGEGEATVEAVRKLALADEFESGGRDAVRTATTRIALQALLDVCRSTPASERE